MIRHKNQTQWAKHYCYISLCCGQRPHVIDDFGRDFCVGLEERGSGDVCGLAKFEDVGIGDAGVKEERMIELMMIMMMRCGALKGVLEVFAGGNV